MAAVDQTVEKSGNIGHGEGAVDDRGEAVLDRPYECVGFVIIPA